MTPRLQNTSRIVFADVEGRCLRSSYKYQTLKSASEFFRTSKPKSCSNGTWRIDTTTQYIDALEQVLDWITHVLPLALHGRFQHWGIMFALPKTAIIEFKLEILAICHMLQLVPALRRQKLLRDELYRVAKGQSKHRMTPELLLHIVDTLEYSEPVLVNNAMYTFVRQHDVLSTGMNRMITQFCWHGVFQDELTEALEAKKGELLAVRAKTKARRPKQISKRTSHERQYNLLDFVAERR